MNKVATRKNLCLLPTIEDYNKSSTIYELIWPGTNLKPRKIQLQQQTIRKCHSLMPLIPLISSLMPFLQTHLSLEPIHKKMKGLSKNPRNKVQNC